MATAAVVAVSVAPAAALLAEDWTVGFQCGHNAIVEPLGFNPWQDYYQIRWPVSNQTFEFGTYIGGGLMEHRADFDENGTAWVPKELEGRSDISYTYVDPACDRLPMFGRLEFYNCEISDLKVNDGSALLSPDNA